MRSSYRQPFLRLGALTGALSVACRDLLQFRPVQSTSIGSLSAALTPEQLAQLLREVAEDRKAWDTVVLDVRDRTTVADYFVICEGDTDRQTRAIADAMVERAREVKLRPLAIDGYQDATWILLDFDSVLAHIFLPGERSYYDLEALWAAVEKVRRRDAS